MASRLTQASHKGRPGCSHLTRKEGVYYYRRRLPDHLGTDVAVSLGTRNFREAEHLAEALDLIYRRSVKTASAPGEVRAILRTYLTEQLAEDADMRLTSPPGRPVYTSAERVGHEERTAVDVDLEIIDHVLGEARERLANRLFTTVGPMVAHLASEHSIPVEQHNALAHGLLEADVKALEEIRRRVLGETATVLTDDLSSSPVVTILPIASGPLFSISAGRYVEYGKTAKAWRGQTTAQSKATFAMFQEIVGDRPVASYTRKDLSIFYDTLRGLPSLYSKDRRWRNLPLSEVAEASAGDTVPRLAMKTVKRHFSALGGFFAHAKQHGQFDGENPAYGFQFPTRGRSNSGRKVWEGEKLQKLFQSPVWTGSHPVFRSQPATAVIRDDKYWLPLLGLYHGNRLEEFAQLRREDLKQKDGVNYFLVCPLPRYQPVSQSPAALASPWADRSGA